MTEPSLIIEIAGKGGGIKVIGRRDADGVRRFSVQLRDQSYMFVSDGEGGGEIRKDSAWMTSWDDVIKTLGTWPWADLHALYVHPELRERVLLDVEQYRRFGELARARAIGYWREACDPGAQALHPGPARGVE